jgi:hypothetical protein
MDLELGEYAVEYIFQLGFKDVALYVVYTLCIITMQALCRSGTAWASCEVNPVIQWPFDFQGLTRVDDQWS